MNRRAFLGSLAGIAGGLVLPREPRRVYSFASELRVPGFDPRLVTMNAFYGKRAEDVRLAYDVEGAGLVDLMAIDRWLLGRLRERLDGVRVAT